MELLSSDQLKLVVKKKVCKTKLRKLVEDIANYVENNSFDGYNSVLGYMNETMKQYDSMFILFENYFDGELENNYTDCHRSQLNALSKKELIDELIDYLWYGSAGLENNTVGESFESFYCTYKKLCEEFIIKSAKIAVARYYKNFLLNLGGKNND